MSWSERLANISLPYIVAAVIVLFAARLLLVRQKSDVAKSAAEIVESVMVAIVLVFLIIRPFVVQAFYIPSESMRPTLEVRDHILVNKFVYRFTEPRHGDIVVFKSPPRASFDGEQRDYIKRLIGLPGDVIEFRAAGANEYGNQYFALYRNGQRANEPYLYEQEVRDHYGPLKVPEGMLFMMGDNRNNSNDSRVWGPLDRSRVIGKAMVRFWPIDRAGLLH